MEIPLGSTQSTKLPVLPYDRLGGITGELKGFSSVREKEKGKRGEEERRRRETRKRNKEEK